MNRRLAIAFVTFTGLALAAGCERVAYYSVGGDAPEGEDGASGPSSGVGATGSAGSGGATSSARRRALASMATCAEAGYVAFDSAAADLAEKVAQLEDSPNETTLEAARASWSTAMARWQHVEVVGVGPTAPPSTPGGLGLRDLVYSWPLVSRCLVEQTLVSEAYASDTFLQTSLINQRGLAALEYLLFYEGGDNACSETSSINAQGKWSALGDDELAARKRAYAAVLAKDVAEQAGAIAAGWGGNDGARRDLEDAGGGSSVHASEQAALNAMTDGLFYVYREVSDLKLGKPLGLYDCTESSCPEAAESQFARQGRAYLRHNLLGARALLAGCPESEETGIDGLLREVGATELADRLLEQLDASLAATDALPTDDLVAALSTDRALVEALHTSTNTLGATMKTELMTVLDLEPPQVVEGDND